MREERGPLSGDLIVSEPFTIWGSVSGNVTVTRAGKLYMRGNVYGNLVVESGGRVHVYGNVGGDLIVGLKAKVIHSGVLNGNAINDGGRLYIEAQAKISGKIKTRSGDTKVDPKFVAGDS